jgi:cell division protein FtsW (lipid II flippase)
MYSLKRFLFGLWFMFTLITMHLCLVEPDLPTLLRVLSYTSAYAFSAVIFTSVWPRDPRV